MPMQIPRIYQDQALRSGTMIELDDRARHYLQHVLRLAAKDSIVLFNGEGGEYVSTIVDAQKKVWRVQIKTFRDISRESPLGLQLVQGIARGEKMDFIIQKSVELGVRSIQPIFTERTTVKLASAKIESRLAHWNSVAISACEQCERTKLPIIHAPVTYTTWLSQIKQTGFILAPQGQTQKLPPTIPIDTALLIGPEGGFTSSELTAAGHRGFQSLSLGPRILRTETAALTALSLFQGLYGDLIVK